MTPATDNSCGGVTAGVMVGLPGEGEGIARARFEGGEPFPVQVSPARFSRLDAERLANWARV